MTPFWGSWAYHRQLCTATLFWLHGHGGEDFEVHDDRSPTGGPGGLTLRGQVRNWARLVKEKPVFDRDTP